MNINASSPAELNAQLSSIARRIDPRGLGRKKEQTEPWVVQRLLPTLVDLDLVAFPLEVSEGERPDVRLKWPGGSAGLELTELVPEAFAMADAIRNREFPNATIDRSIFTWGARFSAAEIRRHLSTVGSRLTGRGWVGDEVEREWATAANERIDGKTQKLKAGYELSQENWLAAYASVPGPALDMEHALRYLKLVEPSSDSVSFDRVFLLTYGRMACVDREGAHVVDLTILDV